MDNQEATQTGAPHEDGGKDAAALHIPAPQAPVKTPRRCAAYPLPLEDGFLAQVVLPLDLRAAEAARLQQFMAALVVPWRVRLSGGVRALWNGGTMFDGLTWNEFGGYYEGDSWAARGNEIERREQQEEREHAAMERMSKLYAEMAQEFADEGKTRRWHSLMQRAERLRSWWHVEAP